MNIPQNLNYTKDHEWIKVEGKIGIIGITDFAQSELGDVVYVDINPELTEIIVNLSFGTIEAVKTVSDLYAPVTGKILELNKRLNDEPQLVNTDPYGDGWLIKIEITEAEQIKKLLDSVSYSAQLGQ
jgi:glycine cleavage system H protein